MDISVELDKQGVSLKAVNKNKQKKEKKALHDGSNFFSLVRPGTSVVLKSGGKNLRLSDLLKIKTFCTVFHYYIISQYLSPASNIFVI